MGHLFAAMPPKLPWITYPNAPFWKHHQPRQAFLSSLIYNRHLSPLVTIHSPAQPTFVLPIQPHLHALSLVPKTKITFFSNMLGHLYLYSLWKPAFNFKPPRRSNLFCQSLCPLTLFPFPAVRHACTHTRIWNSSQSLWRKYNINFKHWHRHWKKHNYSCCTNTHKGLWSKIISWLQCWPQTSRQFLMEPGDFTVCMLLFHIPCCLSCFVNLTRILKHCHLHIRHKKKGFKYWRVGLK